MSRIRTIKPEFWQNEQLAQLSEHARLLAIALLNHADDEGYFLANASLVRAACFPFEEHSKKVLGSLHELSSVGYIEVRECSGKSVGFICTFSVHQRIDKKQKSKLSELFIKNTNENNGSDSAPRVVDEHSTNIPGTVDAWKGTGNREQGKEMEQGNGTVEEETKSPKSAAVDRPHGVNLETWLDWLAVRKAKRAGPITATALSLIQSEADKAGITLNEAVWRAAGSGWVTFKAEYIGGGKNAATQPKTFRQMQEDNTQRAITEFVNGT